jgi:hypothetical protein
MITAYPKMRIKNMFFSTFETSSLSKLVATGINRKGSMNIHMRAVSPFFGAPVRNKSKRATIDDKTHSLEFHCSS